VTNASEKPSSECLKHFGEVLSTMNNRVEEKLSIKTYLTALFFIITTILSINGFLIINYIDTNKVVMEQLTNMQRKVDAIILSSPNIQKSLEKLKIAKQSKIPDKIPREVPKKIFDEFYCILPKKELKINNR